jgi:L,D-peptidoglycan transpeptidase YkuD (ErfK/YbiS/YcfS/YnhG family)
MRRSCGRAAVALLAVLLGACGSGGSGEAGAPTTTTPAGPTTTTTAPATTTAVPTSAAPTTTLVPTSVPRTTDAPPTTGAPATTGTTAVDPALARVGSAGQAIVVTAARYGATTATLTAYERRVDGWTVTFGPWPANVGTRGLAPPGEKREGDGRTPSGVYAFDFLFGVAPDPGVLFPYRRVTDRTIVWDDDPASSRYNTWVDVDEQDAGAEPEPMYVSPAYDHGAVIAYNSARTPGLGSAIFLHVSTGGPTAGCVSLPAGRLVEVLRWLDPARSPRIVLGVDV